MSKIFWNSLKVSSVVLGASVVLASGALAETISTIETAETESITKVAALDSTISIKPGDWQYDALKGMLDKYGCTNNLSTESVSREEFATGVSACLNQVEPILAKKPESISPADLEILQRLTQEFRGELTTIDNRINRLDQRTTIAQANQFSATTKLKGEVVVGLTGLVSGRADDNGNTVAGGRARLLFQTDFGGGKTLFTRLNAGNLGGFGPNGSFKSGTSFEGTQTFEGDTGNTIGVDWLAYQFPWDNKSVYVAAAGGIQSDYVPTNNPFFEDYTGGNGALSFFAEESPIYRIGAGAGVGTTFPLGATGNGFRVDSISVGYLAGSANNPGPSTGFFNGDYALLGQVNVKGAGDKLNLGLTYVNSYHGVGSSIFNGAPVGTSLANNTTSRKAANSYGISGSYQDSADSPSFSAFAMTSNVDDKTGGGNSTIWSFGGGIAVPNVGQPGNVAGLFIGMEPTVTSASGGANVGSSGLHIEGFYKYKLTDNLSITPGFIWLTKPNQGLNNAGASVDSPSALIGTIRTTFTF